MYNPIKLYKEQILELIQQTWQSPYISVKKNILTVFSSFVTPYLFVVTLASVLFIKRIPLHAYFILSFILIVFALVDLKNFITIRKLRNINRQLNYVDQVTQALRRSMKMQEVLDIIIKNLTEELEYSRVIIYTVETAGQKEFLKAVNTIGLPLDKVINYVFPLDKAVDIVPRAAIEKKPYIVRNAKDDYRVAQDFVELLQLKEYVVLPLITKDIAVGVLLADKEKAHIGIKDDELLPLTVFANQAAIAIENARLYEKIEELAIKDGLTNIYNHRFFQDAIRKEVQRMHRFEKPEAFFSLLMIDVDNFKHYNDTNGHQAGDTVLIEIGQILKNLTRKVDTVARYGGEEFIVMLPATPKKGAMMLADRIRQSVEDHPFEFAAKQVGGKLTISIGCSTYFEDGKEPEEIIETADKGLYEAKTSGKNKVICINQPK